MKFIWMLGDVRRHTSDLIRDMPMTYHLLLRPVLLASLLASSAQLTSLGAQAAQPRLLSTPVSDTAEDESHQRPPGFATGIGAGAMRFSTGRTNEGVSGTLQYSPRTWLVLSASPGFGHTTLGQTSSSGLTDIPVSAGASHRLGDIPWSPSISGSLYTTLSLTDSTNALGAGRSTFGAWAGVSGWATELLHLAVGASHSLTANGGNGSIDLESSYSLGKTTANLGFSSEVGRADSGATLARSIAGGVAFAVAGPLTLTIDGSHGLTSGAPLWSFSVGFGTAFAGVSPLNPTSPLRRLKRVLGSRISSTSGYSKSRGGSGSCKRAGTC
jgi:hypothetical protein